MVANGALQHGKAGLERIQNSPHRHRPGYLQLHLVPDPRQVAQVVRKDDADRSMRTVHNSGCTSTETTAGRSRTIGFQLSPASATIGFQLSPASAEPYTCP